jgi:steroid 5-alpha reductase family enzyme
MFVPAYAFKTDKLTDMSYSITFILLTIIAFLLNTYETTKILLLTMISLWGIRLGTFLLIRIRKWKKDKRFDGIREKFTKFLGFWTIQGITVFILLIPALQYMKSEPSYTNWTLIGILVWGTGLVIETVADHQKYKHKGKKWVSTGLWKYSRHPNYFGEILVWLGVYLFTVPITGLWGVISPAFITFMLVFVSGLPKVEASMDKKYGKDKEYQKYKEKTPVLVPFIRK